MKREINCETCARAWLDIAGVKPGDDPIEVAMRAGEKVKRVRGFLKVHCVCDGCNKQFKPGDQAVAVSVYAPPGIDYYEWEHEFISQFISLPELPPPVLHGDLAYHRDADGKVQLDHVSFTTEQLAKLFELPVEMIHEAGRPLPKMYPGGDD